MNVDQQQQSEEKKYQHRDPFLSSSLLLPALPHFSLSAFPVDISTNLHNQHNQRKLRMYTPYPDQCAPEVSDVWNWATVRLILRFPRRLSEPDLETASKLQEQKRFLPLGTLNTDSAP